MNKTAGVYKLTIGKQFYIGSSVDIKGRVQQHLSSLKNGRSPKKLQEAYNEARELNIDILEVAPDNMTVYELRQLEREWIIKERPELNAAALPGCHEYSPLGNVEWIEKEIARVSSVLSRYDYGIKFRLRMYRALGRSIQYATDLGFKGLRTVKEVHEHAERKNNENKHQKA